MGLFLGGGPFHWIHLALWEGDANTVLVKSCPDGLTQIAPHTKRFKGIAHPEEQLVVDRGIGEIHGEGSRRWVLQHLFVLTGHLLQDRDHLTGFVVVSRSHRNHITAGGLSRGVRLRLLGEEVLVGDQQFGTIAAAAQLRGAQPQLAHGAGVAVDHQDFARANGALK